MKFSILFLALLASACGNYGPISSDADRVGDVLPVVSGISSTERSNLTLICDSIANKEGRLSQLVGINLPHNISQKNCNSSEQVEEGINIVIEDPGAGNFSLRRVDNAPFIFSNVETLSSGGILSSICSAYQSLSNPEISTGSGIVQFSTVGIDTAFCSPSGEEVCLRTETARASDRIVHTKEWIKVLARPSSVNLNRAGLVTDRRRVTAGFCDPNEVSIHRATLQ